MKRIPLLLLFITALVFTSCGSGAAQKVADEFHQKLDEKDYEYILDNLLDAGDEVGRESFAAFFEVVDSWGEQKNRKKKLGFSSKIINGISTSKINYSFECDGIGVIHESIVLRDVGEGYKVFVIKMDTDESAVTNATSEY